MAVGGLQKVALIILDGAGLAPAGPGNCVTEQTLPSLFRAMHEQGYAALDAAGPAVGLEEGQIGNSEVGHLTIGLGRVEPSALSKINTAFRNKHWLKHPLWEEIAASSSSSRLHVVGLLSDAGVHAHWKTIWQAACVAQDRGIEEIIVHVVLDGVDSQAGTAPKLLEMLRTELKKLKKGVRLGVVMGRQWFTDRSGNFELTRVFADAVFGRSILPPFTEAALAGHLEKGENEANFPAHLAKGGTTIRAGEAVIITSHRADRACQAASVLGEQAQAYALVTLGESVALQRVFFPTQGISDGLAFVLREHGILSVRVAEDCKFPHVTFFMNGFNQTLGEQQVRIPAHKTGPEQRPEMALGQVVDAIIKAFHRSEAQVVIANLANLDQVGHTGRIDLVEQAVMHVETALCRIAHAAKIHGWTVLLTADHGSAEQMLDGQGRALGSHSLNPVPLTVIPASNRKVDWLGAKGELANIAPSLLCLLGVSPGPGMEEPILRWAAD